MAGRKCKTREDADKAKRVLNALKISIERLTDLSAKVITFENETDGEDENYAFFGELLVARDDSKIDSLTALIEDETNYVEKSDENIFGRIPEYHRKYGQLVGIPETAIDGFVSRQSLAIEDIPEDIAKHPYYNLLDFALSKNSYKDEWSDFVKKTTDTLKIFKYTSKMFKLPQPVEQ